MDWQVIITLLGMIGTLLGVILGAPGYWELRQKKLEMKDPENHPTNKTIIDKLNSIEEDNKDIHTKVGDLTKQFEFSEMNEARRRIITAAEEIENREQGRFPISKERGMQLRKDIKTYEEFCRTHEDYENESCPVAIRVCEKYMDDDGEWFSHVHHI